ncbi:MAG: hypothetical protein D6761_03910 [Candidatus Dadabacteria bacterium]|nr:MAG: hypothetical protein D6761_03910 [Candidatus Dadabacteria bacterium]
MASASAAGRRPVGNVSTGAMPPVSSAVPHAAVPSAKKDSKTIRNRMAGPPSAVRVKHLVARPSFSFYNFRQSLRWCPSGHRADNDLRGGYRRTTI